MVRKIKLLTLSVAILAGLAGAGRVLAFSSGEKVIFNADRVYDAQNRSQVTATLRMVSDKALFYIDDDWWNKLNSYNLANAAIVNLAKEFDQTIYPRLTKVYGSEWSPGIDNEGRITIFIVQMKEGTGGYFNSADEFFKSQIISSNEREMIYLNSLYLGTSGVKGYLAHEFHHLINFYQKEKLHNITEDIWLNEARSEYALTLCGYDNPLAGSHLERRVNEFKRNPADSLTEWQNVTDDYAPVNLFLQYLVGRYGEGILTKMMDFDSSGIAEINGALEKIGSQERFADIYANWIVANYLNNCLIGEGQKYCYLDRILGYDQIHVSPSVSSNLLSQEGSIFSFTDRTKDWAGRWYEINIPNSSSLNLSVSFQGQAGGNFVVPYIIYSKSVKFLTLDTGQKGIGLILGSPSPVKKIILMPLSKMKTKNFLSNETAFDFSFAVKATSDSSIYSAGSPNSASSPAAAVLSPIKSNYPDGSLVRASGDSRVYIINGGYRRWLQSPQIFSFYSHFNWQQIIIISQEELSGYQEAWLVRASGDSRVYEINGDGTKHWLNMTAEQFSASGRRWDMVYTINKAERNFYQTGAEVLR
ncbi:MAG: hypothetical protein UV36_C0015G0011 [Parcubacteria group bacterium GW2011_GWC2_42_6]|nr:MAG: hypothetical protein UV36_C0015G0011 [Parcubacteria group bacterium GW2011_GWC2_42_6]